MESDASTATLRIPLYKKLDVRQKPYHAGSDCRKRSKTLLSYRKSLDHDSIRALWRDFKVSDTNTFYVGKNSLKTPMY